MAARAVSFTVQALGALLVLLGLGLSALFLVVRWTVPLIPNPPASQHSATATASWWVPAGLWVAGTGLAVLLLGVLLYVVLPVAFAAAARWGARVRERRDARRLARVAEQSRPARGGGVARRPLLPTQQLNRIWLVLAILALLFPFVAMIVELSLDDPIPAAVVGVMMIVFFAVVIAAWRIGARRGAALPASPASTDSVPPAAHPTAPAAPEPAPRSPDGSDS
jgi:hypothetical protein